ncbi:MAG: hypothetical protein RL213_1322 [Bacteroidota bacterium]|jgi:capsular exopolysaccharide synthesis family protein
MSMSAQQQPASHRDDEIDLRTLFRDFRRRWYLFPASALLCFLVAFAYMKVTDPVFEATASILVKDSKNKSGSIENILAGDLFGNSKNVATEIGILTSRSVLREAVHELNMEVSVCKEGWLLRRPVYRDAPFHVSVLRADPGICEERFRLKTAGTSGFEVGLHADNALLKDFDFEGAFRFGDTLRSTAFELVVSRNDSFAAPEENGTYSFVLHSELSLFRRFEERLTAEPLNKEATIVKLTYEDELRDRSVDFLNALGRAYINQDVKDKSSVAGLTLRFVDERLQDISGSLQSTEEQLQRFKEDKGTVNLSEEGKAYLERVTAIDAERAKTEMGLKSLEMLLAHVQQNKDLEVSAPSAMGNPDPMLAELISRLSRLQSQRRALLAGSSDQSPAIRSVNAQIEEARTALLENINSLRSAAAVQLGAIREELSGYESTLKRIPQIERELLGIQRNFSVNENIYLYLLQKKAETGIAQATAVSDNRILDGAVADSRPVSPDRSAVAVIALLSALLLPAGWITFRTYNRSTVGGREDIERLTRVPVVGSVGHHSGKDRLVVAVKPKSAVAEAFRSIRANLMFMGLAEEHRTLVVTSSVGGEGKSFVALNLATVLAMQQHKVVLVGMDLRKPQLFKELGADNEAGISTLLIGRSRLDDLIRHTPVSGMDLIPAGPVPPNPAELLARSEVKQLIEDLKQRYDYIIIDTPPVGIVSDAMSLLTLADINIYIVREDYTRRDHLRTAEDIYRSGKVRNLCLLINDASGSDRYGYGYTGYGYYEEERGVRRFWKKSL